MENLHNMAENRIKAVLADKRKTCKWLAQEIGMSENTVSRWCSNKIQPSLIHLGKVANALDIDIRELIRPTKNIC
jgi:transcriptional regulator with XRE-family HTH domain